MTNLNLLSLFGLPTDIIILIFEFLLLEDLSALSQTSRFFHALVNEFGWAGYQRQNPRPSTSLTKSRMAWSPMARVKHDVLADRAWSLSEFIARPLSAPWPKKERPVMAINSSRLVVAAGTSIYSYTFGVSADNDAPPVALEGSCSLSAKHNRKNCITALTFIPDGGLDNTLCVGFQDGTLERVVLQGPSTRKADVTLRVQRAVPQPVHPDHIESLATSPGRNLLLSLSAGGRVVLEDTQNPTSTSAINLQTRSWVSHLCMESSSPYAAFGTSSLTPLAIHSIRNDRLTHRPVAVLAAVTPSSAVYGICSGPPSSLWGASPEVVVSGWYNGTVSIHDLRSSSRSCSPENQATDSPAPLRPEMTLVNSWSDEPIYSVSSGGGGGTHIAAGAARHSLVSVWDVRYPIGGFSVHAPLNDRSPVYSVILESSRLFGVTESRPFAFDFGPGITQSTYPDLGLSTEERSTWRDPESTDGLGYYVTKYGNRR
ncbi:hypothetical protein B0H16DRAFT_1402337 [Mycena metata]|uniref:F-box domain-containing protein n=1 Tax=Mycena metata TaxID=1033252 RepID=A0AAD7P1D8_9AGAR|nr:hypothetical protein B0H16DRAFT_1402337 [Mycena metata]